MTGPDGTAVAAYVAQQLAPLERRIAALEARTESPAPPPPAGLWSRLWAALRPQEARSE